MTKKDIQKGFRVQGSRLRKNLKFKNTRG
jgi:hypothetical protein